MACLAFGRGAAPPSPASASAGRAGGAADDPADTERQLRALAVHDDPARIAGDNAIFEAVAQQVTAFICNLDEATVNCGAAEAQQGCGSPGAGSISGASATAGVASSREARAGSSAAQWSAPTSRSSSLGGSGSAAPCSVAGSSSGGSSGGGGGPAVMGSSLFRRLGAAGGESGFGWRERRAAFEAAMQRENKVERLVARSGAAAAEKRLQHRLLVARLEAHAFRGCTGGNALFDAVSLALWGTASCGRALRALAVSHAARHPDGLRCFLGDDWPAYLSGMARNGTPGDELMLRAVSDHFGVPVNIVTSDAFMWFQRYSPVKTRSQREVTLAFLGPNTWMPVRRQSVMTALRLGLSGSSEWRQARDMRRKMQQLDLQPPSTPR